MSSVAELSSAKIVASVDTFGAFSSNAFPDPDPEMTRAEQNRPDVSGPSVLQNTVAALAVVIAAGLVADLVLWPRDQLPPVTAVDEHTFFTQAFIDRAQDFRGIQSWLGIAASLAIVVVPLADRTRLAAQRSS